MAFQHPTNVNVRFNVKLISLENENLLLIILFQLIMICDVFGQTKLIEKVNKADDKIVIPYEKYKLSNGLTLILHEDHSDPLIHLDVYHVGSAREEIKKSDLPIFLNI